MVLKPVKIEQLARALSSGAEEWGHTMVHDFVLDALFETEALKVADAEQPFWYTSGKFGPFYVNTHFLYGSAAAANGLLTTIEEATACPLVLPHKLLRACHEQLEQSAIYRGLLDLMVEAVKDLDFDFISGGERRDFFFSIPLAERLDVPHLSILKDGRCFISEARFAHTRQLEKRALAGQRALHVADLVTEASSYFRAWLPALEELGAVISDTLAIVDRQQGGAEALADAGIRLHCLLKINDQSMDSALEKGLIDAAQREAIRGFMADPDAYMRHFLAAHPDFLEREAQRDAKTAERVARCRSLGFA